MWGYSVANAKGRGRRHVAAAATATTRCQAMSTPGTLELRALGLLERDRHRAAPSRAWSLVSAPLLDWQHCGAREPTSFHDAQA